MSLKKKLNRLKPHLTGGQKPLPAESAARPLPVIPEEIPYSDIWEQESVKPYFFDGNYCLVREVTYPLMHKHGKYRFADAAEAVARWNEAGTSHPLSAAGHKPGDLFFFDTETTGLGGGAGNTIFLLGHARLTSDRVVLTQHILPQPGAEVALYQSFLASVDYTTLVTYNGKAFDWPQVKTRHTLVRDHVPKLPAFGHFDLFHGARRLWKHKIDRMKLSAVEKEILGFERKDDIPGYLAPMIYFDFLERKNPEGLLGVIKHNELDILSLITLYAHLSFQLLGEDRARTSKEAFEVGRWFSYLGEREKAKELFQDIAEAEDSESIAAKHALAYEFKRVKEWKKAVPLWESSASGGEPIKRVEACIELAKYHEHHSKDYEAAAHYCEKAISLLNSMENGKKNGRVTADLDKRINRIMSKQVKREHISVGMIASQELKSHGDLS
ncbi:ribonuclease H-like domain-containing protein [Mesobacillus foraminis]|uniref:ribonuclease H-like domain-containing protein n=1 Tax=Mesobacillus foraminis TaxID=279826 RepID=UPI00399FFAA2